MITIDFESMPIEPRPAFPPKPVCVSIKETGKKPVFAFGMEAMRKALTPIFKGKQPLCFHNAAFDLAVAVEKLGLPMPAWQRVHDTKYLLFLSDPYKSLALKTACADLLGIGVEDQEELESWIREHVPEAKNKKAWGAWIGYAPERLLRKRAHGDTIRTEALFKKLMPEIEKRGMAEAYDRERRLLPMLQANSRDGVLVDSRLIRKDTAELEEALIAVDQIIRKKLRAPSLNPGSGQELLEVLELRKMGGNWLKTPTGKNSSAKNSLLQGVKNKEMLALLQYRGKCETALTTFLRNWCEVLDSTGNKLHTDWNQVKGEGAGAATGRKSSRPNFQNIPKGLKADDLLASHGLRPMPLFRYYFLPDKGETWIRRDFSQQELRILAHMAGGNLEKAYIENPKLDLHQHAADSLKHLNLMRSDVQVKVNRYDSARGIAKMIAFSILYGMGNAELSYRLGIDGPEAKKVRDAYLGLFPGLKDLQDELKYRASIDKPIRTWGGREYYCQPPSFFEGRLRKFDYKLLNYLIQGSAADMTKEALCRLWEAGLPGRLMLDVHDEISWSVPGNEKQVRTVAAEIGIIMCSAPLKVPMLSDLEIGKCWGAAQAKEGWL
jgi:DNA polymerase I-like protein with 3'-5' exonuclease and polymerase domains